MNSQKSRTPVFLLLHSVIAIIVALLASEIVLQLLDKPKPIVSGWLNCESVNPEECNDMGFRGREIAYSDDDFVVILLGDSEVYAASFPFEQMPERRLEHFLQNYRENVKVFTIGDMGYGQDQQYLALKKYFEKHRADLVLLKFTARNDIANNIFPTAGGNFSIKPTYWLKNNELRGPTEKWLEPIGPSLKLSLLWKIFFNTISWESRHKMWEEKILPPIYQPLSEYRGEINYAWQQDWDSGRREYIQNTITELSCAGNLSPRSERMKYGINLTRKLLFEMKKLVEDNNSHFIIFKAERADLQYVKSEEVYFLNGKYYKLSFQQIQENLKDLFRDFEYYNIPLTVDNPRISQNDTHLNEQATDKLMKELSLIISRKDYFK